MAGYHAPTEDIARSGQAIRSIGENDSLPIGELQMTRAAFGAYAHHFDAYKNHMRAYEERIIDHRASCKSLGQATEDCAKDYEEIDQAAGMSSARSEGAN